jgi:hypothetical protein
MQPSTSQSCMIQERPSDILLVQIGGLDNSNEYTSDEKALDTTMRLIAYTSCAIATLCQLYTKDLLKIDLYIPWACPLDKYCDLWGPSALEQPVLYPRTPFHSRFLPLRCNTPNTKQRYNAGIMCYCRGKLASATHKTAVKRHMMRKFLTPLREFLL